ncbi:unnamed protein product [Leptidea sinapis]|uniref:Zinc finger PHD-type domain-containing protein n=1 Tax=Leptidea sinapis TaxID=189913 RepID=A0A5E4PSK0_9NEOP|nr:unnamed protein product [Leptidea sinapis]
MVQCNKCKLFVSLNKDEIVKCKGAQCDTVYHKKCVRSKSFLQTGICSDCKGKQEGTETETSVNEASPDILLKN